MTSGVRRLGIGLLSLFLCAACQRTPARTIHVLFIGNSYTSVNNLPAVFAALAKDGGQAVVQTHLSAPGGWFLKTHWEQGDGRRLLAQQKWDYVVLQEQSLLGSVVERDGRVHIANDEFFHPYAVMWVRSIKEAGSMPVLYLTWAHKPAPEDQSVLNDAYQRVAGEEKAVLAPAGIAWAQIREQHPEIELFQPDGSHPSPAGTYLAACTFYAAIFRQSPVGLTAKIKSEGNVLVDLPKEEARTLQAAAWQVTEPLPTR